MKKLLVQKVIPPYNLRLCNIPYTTRARPPGYTDDELPQWMMERQASADRNDPDGPSLDMTKVYVVEEEDLPQNHYFFPAWRWDESSNSVKVDRDAAEAIHMQWIRVVRDKDLVALDGPMMRAVETGDAEEEARLKVVKQTLRNLPQTFDLTGYVTLDDLQASWPSQLSQRLP
jgi:hypothetical protein